MEARAQLERRLAQREKEKKEEHLRVLAQRARDHRAGENSVIVSTSLGGSRLYSKEREFNWRADLRRRRSI